MVAARNPVKKMPSSPRTRRTTQESGNVTSKPVAARTEAPTQFRPRFALNPPKIEKFFERAIQVGSLVTLTLRDDSRIEGATPIGVLPTGYRIKDVRARTVTKDAVKRIDTTF